jgi:hypothetical protein
MICHTQNVGVEGWSTLPLPISIVDDAAVVCVLTLHELKDRINVCCPTSVRTQLIREVINKSLNYR